MYLYSRYNTDGEQCQAVFGLLFEEPLVAGVVKSEHGSVPRHNIGVHPIVLLKGRGEPIGVDLVGGPIVPPVSLDQWV